MTDSADAALGDIARGIVAGQPDDIDREYSVDEYALEKFQDEPYVEDNAFQRVYRMLQEHGIEQSEIRVGDGATEQIDVPKLFTEGKTSLGREGQLLGIDESLNDFYTFVRGGALGHGDQKAIKLMLGPVSGGKTTMANALKQGYEDWSETDAGAVYTLQWDVSDNDEHYERDKVVCEIQESPLRLFPQEQREQLIDQAMGEDGENLRRALQEVHDNWDIDEDTELYDIDVVGDLCAQCQTFYDLKLEKKKEAVAEEHGIPEDELHRLDDDWLSEALERVYDEVSVVRVPISQKDKTGIGYLKPADPKNQDRSELTGDVNMQAAVKYGQGDGRAYNYELGALLAGNRGITDIEEILKCDIEFMYEFLEASEHGEVDPQKLPSIRVDTMLLGRTNAPEYEEMADMDDMEAFMDRTDKTDVPYPTDYTAQEEILEIFTESARESGKHFMPHTLEALAKWATMTRVGPAINAVSQLDKVKAYGGEDLGSDFDLRKELMKSEMEDGKDEGMTGVSQRVLRKVLSTVAVEDHDGCVNAYEVFDELVEKMPDEATVPDDKAGEDGEYRQFIEEVKEDLEEELVEDVMDAITADPQELRDLEEKYRTHVRAYNDDRRVEDPTTGEMLRPQENDTFMRSIEKQEPLEVTDARTDNFRKEIDSFLAREDYDTEHPLLESEEYRTALRNHLWQQKSQNINWQAMVSDVERTSDAETRERTNQWIENLKDEGYCDTCAEQTFERIGKVLAEQEREEAA